MEKKNKKKERQIHSRDMPNFIRNDTDKRKVIKDKKSILKTGVEVIARKGAKTALDQLIWKRVLIQMRKSSASRIMKSQKKWQRIIWNTWKVKTGAADSCL